MAIDSRDAEGYVATFTPDGVFDTFNGHDALAGFIHRWRETMKGAKGARISWGPSLSPAESGMYFTMLVYSIRKHIAPESRAIRKLPGLNRCLQIALREFVERYLTLSVAFPKRRKVAARGCRRLPFDLLSLAPTAVGLDD
jgi:hypothetical protein